MYALIRENYDRPMFPIPMVIHLSSIIIFCYKKYKKQNESEFGKYFLTYNSLIRPVVIGYQLNFPIINTIIIRHI